MQKDEFQEAEMIGAIWDAPSTVCLLAPNGSHPPTYEIHSLPPKASQVSSHSISSKSVVLSFKSSLCVGEAPQV